MYNVDNIQHGIFQWKVHSFKRQRRPVALIILVCLGYFFLKDQNGYPVGYMFIHFSSKRRGNVKCNNSVIYKYVKEPSWQHAAKMQYLSLIRVEQSCVEVREMVDNRTDFLDWELLKNTTYTSLR